MHARELVEVAALAATQGPGLIAGPGKLSAAALEQYWSHSKCRLDRWFRALKAYSSAVSAGGCGAHQWRQVRPVVEEVFCGELLTRVWAAVLCGYDHRRRAAEAGPVARSVLLGHLEARHRAMSLLLYGPSVGTQDAVALNRLRRRTERWTDLLLGYLQQACDVAEAAIDHNRALEFAEDIECQQHRAGGGCAWALTLASLRMAYRSGLCDESPNADLNAQIAGSVLASFPPELFDATGVFRSLWLQRLTNTASDAQGMIDDILRFDAPKASKPGAPTAHEHRPGEWPFERRAGQ